MSTNHQRLTGEGKDHAPHPLWLCKQQTQNLPGEIFATLTFSPTHLFLFFFLTPHFRSNWTKWYISLRSFRLPSSRALQGACFLQAMHLGPQGLAISLCQLKPPQPHRSRCCKRGRRPAPRQSPASSMATNMSSTASQPLT